MKKWIIVGLSLAVAGTGSTVFAATPEQTAPNSPVVTSTANLPASVIDDIAIPYDVVMYAQLEYQGYAITHAHKIQRNGQQVYQLQITRDDTGGSYDGYVLWYDMSWKLLTQEKMTQPIIIKKEEPTKPKPTDTPATAPPAQQQPVNNDSGGRGGGNDGDRDEEKPDDEDEDDKEEPATTPPAQGSLPSSN